MLAGAIERPSDTGRTTSPSGVEGRIRAADEAPVATEFLGQPLPDKPSIAVLAFENLSGDPEQRYFSDGITSDIITGLGRFRGLFVIADTSSFAYRDKGVPVQKIGHDLGVRHVLKGSVRAAGGTIRVSAQLVDAATGQSVWAENYDRVLDDVFAVQDEITQSIVATLAGRLEDAAHAHALQEGASTASVYDYLLRGRQYLAQGSKDDVLKARAIFEQARELDPNHAASCIELANTYGAEFSSSWSQAPDLAGEQASSARSATVVISAHESGTAITSFDWPNPAPSPINRLSPFSSLDSR